MNKNRFRIWDTKTKEYCDEKDILVVVASNGDVLYKAGFQELLRDTENRFIIERCLNLKDRDGKLIYEGDVLQKIEKDFFEKSDRRDIYKLDNLRSEGKVISEKEEVGDFITVVYRGAIDLATMERLPVFWLKEESFGYEGEELQQPSDWKIIGTIHDTKVE